MKVGIYTLGCKVNTYESEFIISLFKNRGYTICDFNDDCDIYIINTCTVTNNSDRKDRKIINSVKIEGYVGEDYKTKPKDIDKYVLVDEKYPENDEGKFEEFIYQNYDIITINK